MRHHLRNSLVSASTLIGGATVALLVMIYPWTIAFSGPGFRESLFAVATFAAAGGFILGLGYRPSSLLFRRLVSPWVVIPMILISLAWIGYALHIGPDALSAHG